MKKLILGIFILISLSFSSILNAQDGVEYAVIEFVPVVHTLEVSINGTEYKSTKLVMTANKSKDLQDYEMGFNPLLSEISEMTKVGWVVMSFDSQKNSAGTRHYAYLSRKKD